MIDILYAPDERWLDPDEVLRRIAPAFRHVTIDRARADRMVAEKDDQLVVLNAPDVILQSHRHLFGRTAWVTLADDDAGESRIDFLLTPLDGIFVRYETLARRERCQPVILKLAELLTYQVSTRTDVVS